MSVAPDPGSGTVPAPAPAPTKEQAKPAEQQVPLSRLNQESGKRVRAENAARQAQQQLEKLQAQVAALEKRQEPTPAGRRFKDNERETLYRQLGGGTGDAKADEAAATAVQQMDEHTNAVLREKGVVSAEEVAKIVQHYVGLSEQKNQVLYGITNRVNGWIQKGIVSQDQAQAIHGKVLQTIQQYPDIMQQPHNISFLLDREFAAAVESGEVKPYSTPVVTSPLQPSGNGSPARPEEVDYSQSPIRAMRGIDPEKLKKARQMSIANHRAATERA